MYYVLLNGTQTGPYSLDQLKELWKENKVNAETLFWQEGMAEWQPLSPMLNLVTDATHFRIIGGFWARLGAYMIDTLILGALGLVLGLFLSRAFTEMGVWGLLIGLTISAIYFGLLNSAIGRGQTVGKRALGLEVVDHEGRHLSPGRSILRYLVFCFPFYLNGVVSGMGLASTSWQALALGVLIFAGGGAILYLYIFNGRTRQSLHDLAVRSYVVRASPQSAVNALPVWIVHLIVVALLFVLSVGVALAASKMTQQSFLGHLLTVQQDILATGKFNTVGVYEGVNTSNFNGDVHTAKVFSVTAKFKEKPEDVDAAAKEIAAIVFKDYPDVIKDDNLNIQVASGYNIGIFSSSWSQNVVHDTAKWESMLH
jgi:uncharacterized RDD family membrane protein YckC